MVRALSYDGTSFWLMTKRLSKGKFQGWPSSHKNIEPIIAKQLRKLLTNKDPLWEKHGSLFREKEGDIIT
jgi:transposase